MIDFPQEDYSTLDAIRRTGGIARMSAGREIAGSPWRRWRSRPGWGSDPCPCTWDSSTPQTRPMPERCKNGPGPGGPGRGPGDHPPARDGPGDRRGPEDLSRYPGHPALAVNFDPANMILYGKGDPVAAVQILSLGSDTSTSRTRSGPANRHLGDGGPVGRRPGPDRAFLDALGRIGYKGTLAIERESGDRRIEDIQGAIDRLAANGD